MKFDELKKYHVVLNIAMADASKLTVLLQVYAARFLITIFFNLTLVCYRMNVLKKIQKGTGFSVPWLFIPTGFLISKGSSEQPIGIMVAKQDISDGGKK